MEHNGYDLLAYLPHLWEEIDEKTPKIRVDYYETLCDMYKNTNEGNTGKKIWADIMGRYHGGIFCG